MYTILHRSDYAVMPWKNGKGVTAQIALDSQQSSFPNNFVWRLSSAQVRSDDPFSQFPSCERALVVVEGEGLLLNDFELKPLEPLYFSGEQEIYCRLLGGPVVDLGVIFNPKKVAVEMKVRSIVAGAQSFSEAVHFIFVVKGTLQLEEEVVAPGDSIKIVGAASLFISKASPDALGVFISII